MTPTEVTTAQECFGQTANVEVTRHKGTTITALFPPKRVITPTAARLKRHSPQAIAPYLRFELSTHYYHYFFHGLTESCSLQSIYPSFGSNLYVSYRYRLRLFISSAKLAQSTEPAIPRWISWKRSTAALHHNNKYTIDLTHNADCEPLDFPQRLFDRSASELELGECP